MVQMLMLKGADKDALDESRRTPLYLAVCSGHVDTSLARMAASADIGLRFFSAESVDHAATRMSI